MVDKENLMIFINDKKGMDSLEWFFDEFGDDIWDHPMRKHDDGPFPFKDDELEFAIASSFMSILYTKFRREEDVTDESIAEFENLRKSDLSEIINYYLNILNELNKTRGKTLVKIAKTTKHINLIEAISLDPKPIMALLVVRNKYFDIYNKELKSIIGR